MNLEKEIKFKSERGYLEKSYKGTMGGRYWIRKADAIKIAKNYAKLMCEEQRVICFENLMNPKPKHEMTVGKPRFNIPQTEVRYLIFNAPLATEEK